MKLIEGHIKIIEESIGLIVGVENKEWITRNTNNNNFKNMNSFVI